MVHISHTLLTEHLCPAKKQEISLRSDLQQTPEQALAHEIPAPLDQWTGGSVKTNEQGTHDKTIPLRNWVEVKVNQHMMAFLLAYNFLRLLKALPN